jgi:hypothetical protein
MTRSVWFHVTIAVLCALAVVLFLRVRNASGVAQLSDTPGQADLARDISGLKQSS